MTKKNAQTNGPSILTQVLLDKLRVLANRPNNYWCSAAEFTIAEHLEALADMVRRVPCDCGNLRCGRCWREPTRVPGSDLRFPMLASYPESIPLADIEKLLNSDSARTWLTPQQLANYRAWARKVAR